MSTLDKLIKMLCDERGEKVPPFESESQKEYFFRAMVNVRPPKKASAELLRLQDEYLSALTKKRGVVDVDSLPFKDGVALWQGDITRINADAIVNACNGTLLGCFIPGHNCIDNAIHTFAGMQVRFDCNEMMKGAYEPNGKVRVTSAYNLPSKYIFHTVGPQVAGAVTRQDRNDLKSCYVSCIDKAAQMGLDTIAFCCLSTGVFGYPNDEACNVAVQTVKEKLPCGSLKVIFNVFKDIDYALYRSRLD